MHTLYLVCLIVGGIYSVISVLGNGLFDGLDFDLDFDFFLPLKPFAVMVFVTVFGGAGLISLKYLSPVMTLLPSILFGFAFSLLFYYLVYVKLRGYETETSGEKDAILKRAEVVEGIPAGGYGKISYVLDSNILSGAAKEFRPGGGIPKGAAAYIMDIKDNVYYVVEDLDFQTYILKEKKK